MEKLQLKWLRSQMGLVNQEPALFATSIADNILFGKDSADMDQIVEAAKASNAHAFIEGLPDGYHTQVGFFVFFSFFFLREHTGWFLETFVLLKQKTSDFHLEFSACI